MTGADFQSKDEDPSSWALSEWHTKLILSAIGMSPDLDVFADETNTKAPAFFSWHWCPLTAGVNGFIQPWQGNGTAIPLRPLCWVNPPFQRLPAVIQKIKQERADCILIVPDWVESWVALLTEMPVVFKLKLPKIDSSGNTRLLFVPGPRVPRRARERGATRQPNYEVWVFLILWPESHRSPPKSQQH